MTDKINQTELQKLFGDEIPMEAVAVLYNSPDHWTLAQVRVEIRKIAASPEWIAKRIIREASLHSSVPRNPQQPKDLTLYSDDLEASIIQHFPAVKSPEKLILAGQSLATACYNLYQRFGARLPQPDIDVLQRETTRWDEAMKDFRE